MQYYRPYFESVIICTDSKAEFTSFPSGRGYGLEDWRIMEIMIQMQAEYKRFIIEKIKVK